MYLFSRTDLKILFYKDKTILFQAQIKEQGEVSFIRKSHMFNKGKAGSCILLFSDWDKDESSVLQCNSLPTMEFGWFGAFIDIAGCNMSVTYRNVLLSFIQTLALQCHCYSSICRPERLHVYVETILFPSCILEKERRKILCTLARSYKETKEGT